MSGDHDPCDDEPMTPSEEALYLGGQFRRPFMSRPDHADRGLIGQYLQQRMSDGRTIAENLDRGQKIADAVIAYLADECDTARYVDLVLSVSEPEGYPEIDV